MAPVLTAVSILFSVGTNSKKMNPEDCPGFTTNAGPYGQSLVWLLSVRRPGALKVMALELGENCISSSYYVHSFKNVAWPAYT